VVQDNTGDINGLAGQSVEQFICIETVNEASGHRSPSLFLLKMVESSHWHRFFLEAGICFWDLYEKRPEDDQADPEDYPWYDLAKREKLNDTIIRSINITPFRQGVAVTFSFSDDRRLSITTATMEDDICLSIDE